MRIVFSGTDWTNIKLMREDFRIRISGYLCTELQLGLCTDMVGSLSTNSSAIIIVGYSNDDLRPKLGRIRCRPT